MITIVSEWIYLSIISLNPPYYSYKNESFKRHVISLSVFIFGDFVKALIYRLSILDIVFKMSPGQ